MTHSGDIQPPQLRTERVYTSFGFWFGLLAFSIVLDQLVKWVVVRQEWSVFKNYNFAFSVPVPVAVMFFVYAIIFALIAQYVYKQWSTLSYAHKTGWILITAGGVSNVAERIMLGYVRDFIYIGNGVFNVADFYIFLGVILILVVKNSRKSLT